MGNKVGKREFIAAVSRATRTEDQPVIPQDVVRRVYDAMLGEIVRVVKGGEDVTLTGFGRFYGQLHKGHGVQFTGGAKKVIDDYHVLRFSATPKVNRAIGDDNCGKD